MPRILEHVVPIEADISIIVADHFGDELLCMLREAIGGRGDSDVSVILRNEARY